jgi:hypothetical protein
MTWPRSVILLLLVALASSAAQAGEVMGIEHGVALSLPPALPDAQIAPLVRSSRLIEREHDRPHPFTLTPLGARVVKADVAKTVTATLTIPPVAGNFVSISSSSVVPADAAGAVGPDHVVSASNFGVYIHDRSGKLLASYRTLWDDRANRFLFDPRIVYDRSGNRFITMSVDDDGTEHDSAIALAVSESGDAAGVWNRYLFPIDPTDQSAADFTHMEIVGDTLVFTTNVYGGPFFVSGDVFLVPLSSLYAHTPTFTRVRTNVFGMTPVAVGDRSTSTIFMLDSAGGSSASALNVRVVSESGLQYVATVSGLPHFDSDESLIGNQLGSSTPINIGSTDVANAVIRNGVLWAVQMALVKTDSVERGVLQWWKVPLALTSAESGRVEGPSEKVSLGFPSIAVNRSGAGLIGYSVFRPEDYASAGYVYRDDAGNMSDLGMLKHGSGPYAFSNWGDYSTTLVDPVGDTNFWTVQSYARAQNGFGTPATWGMWWGNVPAPTAAAPGRQRVAGH